MREHIMFATELHDCLGLSITQSLLSMHAHTHTHTHSPLYAHTHTHTVSPLCIIDDWLFDPLQPVNDGLYAKFLRYTIYEIEFG